MAAIIIETIKRKQRMGNKNDVRMIKAWEKLLYKKATIIIETSKRKQKMKNKNDVRMIKAWKSCYTKWLQLLLKQVSVSKE